MSERFRLPGVTAQIRHSISACGGESRIDLSILKSEITSDTLFHRGANDGWRQRLPSLAELRRFPRDWKMWYGPMSVGSASLNYRSVARDKRSRARFVPR